MSVVRCRGDGRTDWWTRENDDLNKGCDKWRVCGQDPGWECETCRKINRNALYMPHLVLRRGDMTTGYNVHFHDLGEENRVEEILQALRAEQVDDVGHCTSSRTWSQ
jgi:hypothetical protein